MTPGGHWLFHPRWMGAKGDRAWSATCLCGLVVHAATRDEAHRLLSEHVADLGGPAA